MHNLIIVIGSTFAMAGLAVGQTLPRRATITGGGNSNAGQCIVEVTVDGSAEVEIRGDNATLRNTGGQSPQWRRFECTGAMPTNPPNFRFAGIDGRGSQTLARGPANNAGALVRIADSEGGTSGYTFELFWGGNNGPASQDRFPQDRFPQDRGPQDRGPQDRGPQDRGPQDRGPGGRSDGFDSRGPQGRGGRVPDNQAVQVCQDSVRDKAVARFRTQNIDIRGVAVDNNPGRQDWVNGELALRKRFGRQEVYRFSCSVDFRTGQVRTAQIDQFEKNSYPAR